MFRSPLLAWVLTAFVTQLALLITTLYLHRALSHRAVTLAPPVGATCRVLLWITDRKSVV
jgi:fatty-acid desaturase